MTEEKLDDATRDERWRKAQHLAERGFWQPRPTIAQTLGDLADYADGREDTASSWDNYGEHGPVEALEVRVAGLLGTDAAAYFPSGVMAQQVALRIWSDRMGSKRVALPDLSHLIVHEQDGPRVLHGFEFVHLTTGARTPTAADLSAIPGELAAVLVELPLRDGGYLLPSADDLDAVAEACRARGVPLHLDGARLWESAPFYGRCLDELAGLADSVYVSFYKGLGALSGAALAGDDDFIAEARIWRRRLGGTVFTAAPHALSALKGLDEALVHMPQLHEYAIMLAAALEERSVTISPNPLHTNAFRVFAATTPAVLKARALEALESDHLALPYGWRAADVPGWSFAEVTVTPAMLERDASELARLLANLIQR